LEEQLAEMQTAVQIHGFNIVEKRQIKDWVALRVGHQESNPYNLGD
jgi:hypothetical protein